MKSISVFAAIAVLVLTIGCRNQQQSNATTSTPAPVAQASAMTPEQLAQIGAAIKQSPNDAPRILSDHGLTEESFEQAVRKVAEDPSASKRYADAYRKAGA